MRSIRSSLAITFVSSNGSTVINFLVNLALARLLSPEDIGIYSISAVLVAIAQVFRDFGVGAYLQQERDLTPEKIRAASGVLFASSWALAAIIYLSGDFAAQYYRHPGIGQVMHVLALGFLFIPFGSITHALLTRELRAKEQAIANIFGTTAFASSSIVFALLGFEYMTSAWANLVNIIVTALAHAPFRPKYAPWLPSFRGWRQITHFGIGAVIGNSIAALNTALSDLLLGRLGSPRDVGLYGRANSLSNMFMQIAGPTVNYAALPYLARTFHESGTIRTQLSKATSYLSAVAWPALTIIAIYAYETILFLFGEKWLDCVPVVALTAGIAAINVTIHFLGTALIAIGRPYQASFPAVVQVIARIICILALFQGSLISFAWGMLLGSLVSIPVSLWMQDRWLKFPIRDLVASILPSIGVTLIVAAATASLKYGLTLLGLGYAWQIICLIPIGSAAWYLAIKVLKHPVTTEVDLALTRFLKR